MHKLRYKLIVLLSVLLLFASQLGTICGAAATEVYVGGMPAGFTLGMGGAQVVGICEVLTEGGTACPAREAGIEVGDIIVSFNGITISSAEDIGNALACSNGRKSQVIVKGDDAENGLEKTVTPAKDLASGRYKLGVLIRDSISGIGTVTYIEKDSLRFGSLGHAVANENGKLMSVDKGEIFKCSIVNVIKGERGKAGELKGLFMSDAGIAVADKNCETGIYGNFNQDYNTQSLRCAEISLNAQPGKASIFTTVDGITPKEYSVSIVKVDSNNKQNKNFVLKITDGELLSATGGIVQGMSGSPILQAGKLIGAVTHVFLNDPTRGYGIAINNMMGK